MKCAFCGREFTKDESIEACSGCPISNCKLIRCPYCGYETPPEPALIKLLKRWLKRNGD